MASKAASGSARTGGFALLLGEGLQGLGGEINGDTAGDGAPAAGVVTGGQFLDQRGLHRVHGGGLPGELDGRRGRDGEERPGRGRAGVQPLGGEEVGHLAAIEFQQMGGYCGRRAADIPGFALGI